MGRADGGAGREDGVLLDEGYGSRLDGIPGSLNFAEGLKKTKMIDDRLRLGTARDSGRSLRGKEDAYLGLD